MRLKGYLAALAPVARFEKELPEGSRVRDLLTAYLACHGKGIGDDLRGFLQGAVAENVFVFLGDHRKGKQASLDSVLQEGDIVTVVSPLAGG